MGKATNQIATWGDLESIGYRIPANSNLVKGVTYQDLANLQNASNINYTTKSCYINPSKFSSTYPITYNSNVKEYGSTAAPIPQFMSTMASFNLGSFKIPSGFSYGKCYLPISSVYLLLTSNYTGTWSGDLQVRLVIKNAAGDVVDAADWNSLSLNTYVNTGQYYAWNAAYDYQGNFSGDSNETYYIDVECIAASSVSYYGFFVQIYYTEYYSNITFYAPYKYVRWSEIKGNSGQTYGTSNNASLPIECFISESVSGKTQANTITFYYSYKLSGQTSWTDYTVGTVTLGSDGKVDGSASETANIMLNPKVSGTVIADYLKIKCGTSGGNQPWKYKYNTINATAQSWTAISGERDTATLEFGKADNVTGMYNEWLRVLTGVYFHVGN